MERGSKGSIWVIWLNLVETKRISASEVKWRGSGEGPPGDLGRAPGASQTKKIELATYWT